MRVSRLERAIAIASIAALLGIAMYFRLSDLASIPGIDGDEAWWGVQATRWLHGEPYETRTTSGNPVDLAFLIPLGLMHGVSPPSFGLLRSLPALTNLAALALGFALVRRLYGASAAWIQTIALAIAPTAIAHSRLCQDPSQSILWTSLVLHLSLLGLKERERWRLYTAAALLTFPIAVWSHPTNALVAPFLAVPLAPVLRARFPASRRGSAWFLSAAAGSAALAAATALIAARSTVDHIVGSDPAVPGALGPSIARLIDGGQWLDYLRNYERLLSGVTVYRYLSGGPSSVFAYDAIAAVAAVAMLAGMAITAVRSRAALDHALLFCWASTWLLFYVFAGPRAIEPNLERWGLCLLPPVVLVVGRVLVAAIESAPWIRRSAIACAAGVAALLVASFYADYFREFRTTGGRAHDTFVTAEIEPKQQAFAHVLARWDGNPGAVVFAQQWWLFQPIAYLAQVHPGIAVHPSLDAVEWRDLRDPLERDQVFFVEFAGSPQLEIATRWIRMRHLRSQTTAVHAASGRDLLFVVQVGSANRS
jgi:hypothetical protein